MAYIYMSWEYDPIHHLDLTKAKQKVFLGMGCGTQGVDVWYVEIDAPRPCEYTQPYV